MVYSISVECRCVLVLTQCARTRLITGPVNPKSEMRLVTDLCQDAANHRSCVQDAVHNRSFLQGFAHNSNPSPNYLILVLVPEPRVRSTPQMWQRPRGERSPFFF